MKKYILFSGYNYYPNPAMDDFHGSYDTAAEAKGAFDKSHHDWGQLVDRDKWDVVAQWLR